MLLFLLVNRQVHLKISNRYTEKVKHDGRLELIFNIFPYIYPKMSPD